MHASMLVLHWSNPPRRSQSRLASQNTSTQTTPIHLNVVQRHSRTNGYRSVWNACPGTINNVAIAQ